MLVLPWGCLRWKQRPGVRAGLTQAVGCGLGRVHGAWLGQQVPENERALPLWFLVWDWGGGKCT